MLELAALQYDDRADLTIYILALDIPHFELKIQAPGVQSLPLAMFLPSAAMITYAAGGGVICRKTHISPRIKVPTIIVAYLELGDGLSVAAEFAVLVMFQHFNQVQLTADKIFQDMILCGTFGQGAFSLQEIGEAVLGSFGTYHRGQSLPAKAGDTIVFTSQFLGLLTWGYAVFAIIRIVSTALLLIQLVMWVVNQALTVQEIVTGRNFGLEHGWGKKRPDSFNGDKDA
ncbi:hypothetical protein N7520_006229 [Penicillium odoratum]|uniref:uncharacterized protein n=1 Tax=Penicillium odoratum TaxID=1167516 RepID=UPI002546DD6A|nr:uncharacterized protein N7520_006229 [Penicillium odoratum]KAJ5759073.1 hypothetical protein N7520_006229 [Penicillium odoratum]